MTTIDPKVIGELRALELAGSPRFVTGLIHVFLHEADILMARLQAAFANQDAPLLERAAHLLKGSSGHLGATRISRLCDDLQRVARTADWGRAAELLPDLEQEYHAAKQELEGLR